jgi:hypothetical protein
MRRSDSQRRERSRARDVFYERLRDIRGAPASSAVLPLGDFTVDLEPVSRVARAIIDTGNLRKSRCMRDPPKRPARSDGRQKPASKLDASLHDDFPRFVLPCPGNSGTLCRRSCSAASPFPVSWLEKSSARRARWSLRRPVYLIACRPTATQGISRTRFRLSRLLECLLLAERVARKRRR